MNPLCHMSLEASKGLGFSWVPPDQLGVDEGHKSGSLDGWAGTPHCPSPGHTVPKGDQCSALGQGLLSRFRES